MLLAFLVPSLVLHECVEVMLIGILIIIAFSIRVDFEDFNRPAPECDPTVADSARKLEAKPPVGTGLGSPIRYPPVEELPKRSHPAKGRKSNALDLGDIEDRITRLKPVIFAFF